jgi:protein TonB
LRVYKRNRWVVAPKGSSPQVDRLPELLPFQLLRAGILLAPEKSSKRICGSKRRTQMLQLFDNQAIGSFGKPAVLRSALWTVIIHGSVFLFLLSLALSPAFQTLPDRLNVVRLVATLPAPPLPPRAPTRAASVPGTRVTRVFTATLTAPAVIPNYTPVLEENLEAPPEILVEGGVPGGIPGGLPGAVPGLVGGLPSIELPPPPVQHEPKKLTPPEPRTPQRIQVSADIQEARLLRMIRPEYPPVAKMARIVGTVRLRAIIDAKGKIAQLKIVDGHPLLAAAAFAAVEKWRYNPTFLNGEPVEVATEIIVHFKLV